MKTLVTLFKRTFQEYSADNCSHMAAAISYYVIFSVVPLTVFLLSIFGFVVRSESVREDVSKSIVDFVGIEAGNRTLEPNVAVLAKEFDATTVQRIEAALNSLSSAEQEQLAARLEDQGQPVQVAGHLLGPNELKVRSDNIVANTLRGVSNVSAPLTIVGLIGLAWSASAMFGAIRKSINIAWDVSQHRPVVQQKLIDISMVLALGLFLLFSVSTTGALRALRQLSDKNLGPLSEGTSVFWDVVPFILPAVFSFIMFAFVYRYIPRAQTRFRHIWPGALLATVLFEIMKNGFAIYIANFSNYDLAYGALGGVLIFMLWTYISANILLLGAEMASEYPRVLRGDYDVPADKAAAAKRGIVQTGLRAAKGLFVHHEPEQQPAPPVPNAPESPKAKPKGRAPRARRGRVGERQ
jgi:YihY family inner membrane protein